MVSTISVHSLDPAGQGVVSRAGFEWREEQDIGDVFTHRTHVPTDHLVQPAHCLKRPERLMEIENKREREKERERKRERKRERDKERETKRKRERDKEKETKREIDKERERERERWRRWWSAWTSA